MVTLIKNVAEESKIDVQIDRTLIASNEDAVKEKFIGSPTARINGLDVDHKARTSTNYGIS